MAKYKKNARVRLALGSEVVMMGFSPDSIGTVVRRALTGATDFTHYTWGYVKPAVADQSPSVKSVGITGQLTGSRADLIVADDIEVLNNAFTQK